MPVQTVFMPRFPECWESCGSCASGDVFILEIQVSVGQRLGFDETILTLETGKVALDIPSPYAGLVQAVHVTAGDHVHEGQALVSLLCT